MFSLFGDKLTRSSSINLVGKCHVLGCLFNAVLELGQTDKFTLKLLGASCMKEQSACIRCAVFIFSEIGGEGEIGDSSSFLERGEHTLNDLIFICTN